MLRSQIVRTKMGVFRIYDNRDIDRNYTALTEKQMKEVYEKYKIGVGLSVLHALNKITDQMVAYYVINHFCMKKQLRATLGNIKTYRCRWKEYNGIEQESDRCTKNTYNQFVHKGKLSCENRLVEKRVLEFVVDNDLQIPNPPSQKDIDEGMQRANQEAVIERQREIVQEIKELEIKMDALRDEYISLM